MSPVDRDVVDRKLRHILACLDALREWNGISLQEYRRDRLRRKGTEKYLTEIAGAAVDLNYHLLVGLGEPPPTSYRESFLRLHARNVLSEEAARRLASLAGLRNRLIHLYEEIDDEKVYQVVQELPEWVRRYLEAVERCVGRD